MSNRYRWNSTSRVRHAAARAAVVLGLVAGLASCTSMQTKGESSSYLILTEVVAASGAQADSFGGFLASDVLTLVQAGTDPDGQPLVTPTIYADNGQVSFALGLKDPGTTGSPNLPSTNNQITVTRYRVDFIRADGRNTPGVDVPYGFDGAITTTVGAEGAVASFPLVRIQAKLEAPLKALAGGGGAIAISTIANITFFGRDQAGREVSVSGSIGVTFADWGDPS